MDYQTVAHFSETWGLLFLFVLFVGAVVYAFWPDNKQKFEEAARMPLDDDMEQGS